MNATCTTCREPFSYEPIAGPVVIHRHRCAPCLAERRRQRQFSMTFATATGQLVDTSKYDPLYLEALNRAIASSPEGKKHIDQHEADMAEENAVLGPEEVAA